MPLHSRRILSPSQRKQYNLYSLRSRANLTGRRCDCGRVAVKFVAAKSVSLSKIGCTAMSRSSHEHNHLH